MNTLDSEALARLRNTVTMHSDFLHIPVAVADLSALLDAYVESLERLSPFAHRECDDTVAGYVCGCEQCLAFRFLKKAGRR